MYDLIVLAFKIDGLILISFDQLKFTDLESRFLTWYHSRFLVCDSFDMSREIDPFLRNDSSDLLRWHLMMFKSSCTCWWWTLLELITKSFNNFNFLTLSNVWLCFFYRPCWIPIFYPSDVIRSRNGSISSVTFVFPVPSNCESRILYLKKGTYQFLLLHYWSR